MSLMTGCSTNTPPSNSFYIENIVKSNGEIEQVFAIPTYKNELLAFYDEEKIDKYVLNLSNTINKELCSMYYLKMLAKMLNMQEKQSLISNIPINMKTPFIRQNRVVFSISYNIYAMTENKSSEQTKEKNNMFIDHIENHQEFPFYENNCALAEQYLNILKTSIKNTFPTFNLSSLNYVFEYRYTTMYSRLKSNASCTFKTENGYTHSWVSTYPIQENISVDVWINNINTGMWYLIVLIFFIILTAVFVLITIYKQNKTKNAIHQ